MTALDVPERSMSGRPIRAMASLTNVASIAVVAQCAALDGPLFYLFAMILMLAVGLYIATLSVLFVVNVVNALLRWEQVRSQVPGSVAPRVAQVRIGSPTPKVISVLPTVVLLSISSGAILILTTFASLWRVEGNGPVVSACVLLACTVDATVHGNRGGQSRWILLACAALLSGTSAWIEIDRWWVTAVLAGYKSGLGGFVDHIDWAWPPHAITILLCALAIVVLLQWIVERCTALSVSQSQFGDAPKHLPEIP